MSEYVHPEGRGRVSFNPEAANDPESKDSDGVQRTPAWTGKGTLGGKQVWMSCWFGKDDNGSTYFNWAVRDYVKKGVNGSKPANASNQDLAEVGIPF